MIETKDLKSDKARPKLLNSHSYFHSWLNTVKQKDAFDRRCAENRTQCDIFFLLPYWVESTEDSYLLHV